MKILMVLLFAFAVITFAQEKPVRMDDVPKDVEECVDKIHGNTSAVKMLVKRIMMDKEHRREFHKAMMSDPEMREMMKEMRKMHEDMEHDHKMKDHKDKDDKQKMDHDGMNEREKDSNNNKEE